MIAPCGVVSAALLHAYDIPILIGRDEARRRAEQELAKAKYGSATPDWLTRALDRASALAERFIELLARLAGGPDGAGSGINWGFLIAVGLLLAALVIVVWRVGLPRWRRRSAAGAVEADPTVQPTDYRARAESLAVAGDWRGAVRDRFRALVRELETRTILDVRPARTALETAVGAGRHLPELARSAVGGCRGVQHRCLRRPDGRRGRLPPHGGAGRRRHRSGRRCRPGCAERVERGRPDGRGWGR